jgi:hypothetical protein
MKRSLVLIAVISLLVVISVFVFAACVPSDPAKAKAKYEDKGYTVVFDNSNLGNAAKKVAISLLVDITGDVAASLSASLKGVGYGEIVWFTESKDAKAYENYLKTNTSNSDTYIKRDGKAVFKGDKNVYKMKKAA